MSAVDGIGCGGSIGGGNVRFARPHLATGFGEREVAEW